jgi:hypothetical protein
MEYVQITENLALIKEHDYVVLITRDRESEDERHIFCELNHCDIEKLRKELGR